MKLKSADGFNRRERKELKERDLIGWPTSAETFTSRVKGNEAHKRGFSLCALCVPCGSIAEFGMNEFLNR
ncbi:MAG: hypothetical protein HZA93_05520 [Verrucomicrobia bacterium]|nr:hypothetical protein [Verrucomicrobiota bacterium]